MISNQRSKIGAQLDEILAQGTPTGKKSIFRQPNINDTRISKDPRSNQMIYKSIISDDKEVDSKSAQFLEGSERSSMGKFS
jgi:hypothetical protein